MINNISKVGILLCTQVNIYFVAQKSILEKKAVLSNIIHIKLIKI